MIQNNEPSHIVTIRELTRIIKNAIEQHPDLKDIWIKGEISNFTHHSRGHMYLTLKDEAARIKAVMFAGQNQFLKFAPKNGMKVLVRGEISVYERDGQYQLYIKEMQPDGIGALFLAYEELKAKLAAKGYFDAERKKRIPLFPRQVGVITSPTGAAVRDIITTIKRRFPAVPILLFPVIVQGEHAAEAISKAIDKAQQVKKLDVLIVGRGGGSIEELWSFNEEMVAEAIFRSRIPIISAVGHETDLTIADFVADLRAATPTAAAELCVPHHQELLQKASDLKARLAKSTVRYIQERQEKINKLRNSYAFKYPRQLVQQKEQQLDDCLLRLSQAGRYLLGYKSSKWEQIQKRLIAWRPEQKVLGAHKELIRTTVRYQRVSRRYLEQKQKALGLLLKQLDAHSPLNIMKKGYALVYQDEKKDIVKSVKQVTPGQTIKVQMMDGALDCHIWGIKEEEV